MTHLLNLNRAQLSQSIPYRHIGGVDVLLPPLISAQEGGELSPPCPSQCNPTTPIASEVGWAPELNWTFWKRDKSLIPARIEPWIIQPTAQSLN